MAPVAHRALTLGALALALGCGSGEPDAEWPLLDATIERPLGYAVFIPGDTLRLSLTGSDNQQLGWLGYALSGQVAVRDSARVAGREASVTLKPAIPQSWLGRHPLKAFARDAAGNLLEVDVDTIEVIDAVRRPLESLEMPGPVHDWVIDSSRNLLYLSIPLAQQVAIVDLTTRQWRPPLQLFGNPAGLDLTPSGDSLVVALRRTHYLAIVNLRTSVVDTIRLAIINMFEAGPENVRLMNNRKVIVTTAFDGGGIGSFGMLEYDLATGIQRTRVPYAPRITVLARNSDRSRLAVVQESGCCPAPGFYYSTVADTFVSRLTVDRFFPAVSADADGGRFLIDDVVFDSSLTLVNRLGPITVDSLRNWATTISPSGAFAYIARDRAYKKMRIADASEIARVLIPLTPYRLMMHPDGGLLMAATYDPATGESRLWLVASP